MNYRSDKYGNQLSILGFGCMRFPQKLGRIDMEETEREIMTAYQAGVNYYDTAYIYPGPAGDAQFTVNVNVQVSSHFLGWIMSLGAGIKIVSPDDVVEQMRKEIERLNSQYGL